MSGSYVTYEQPLNEQMRIYLRLEKLFSQYQILSSCQRPQDCKIALESILKIADIADRPDLKPKLLQTLNQRANALTQLEQHPNIDLDKLNRIKNSLQQLTEKLGRTGSNKLAESMRKNPFLKSIRHQLGNPTGVCDFNVPAYTLWLSQTQSQKRADLCRWHQELEPLEQAVKLILKLTRESATTEKISAQNFHHQTLDANLPCQMIRVHIPKDIAIYPEISVSKHRLAIRFKTLIPHDTYDETPDAKEHLNFLLSCCRI